MYIVPLDVDISLLSCHKTLTVVLADLSPPAKTVELAKHATTMATNKLIRMLEGFILIMFLFFDMK